MVEIDFKLYGDRELTRDFRRLEREADDLRRPLKDVGDLIEDMVGVQFHTRGEGSWHALNPEYQRWKERFWPSRPVNVRTGTLKAAALTGARPVAGNRLVYEVGVPYAGYVQAERPFVDVDAGERQGITEIFEDWVDDLTRQLRNGR
jgi:hypothetical protein